MLIAQHDELRNRTLAQAKSEREAFDVLKAKAMA
jgi:hypothetical protein